MGLQELAQKRTGKSSYFVYGGQIIPITRVNVRVTRAMADCTDNGDYDSDADIIGKTQLPVSVTFEGTVEGRYYRSITPVAIVQALFTGVYAVPCVFGLDAQTIIGSGYCDISDYSQDNPVEDVVNFSCTVRSNGLFNPNG